MSWITIIPIITSSLLAVIGVLSFLINSKFTFDNKQLDQLYKQRDSIRTYGISIISTIQSYTTAEIEYLNERLKIDLDIKAGNDIKLDRSQYVYSLKKELKNQETNLMIKIWNSNIEISSIEFNDIQKDIIKSYRKIKVITKNINVDNLIITNEREIQILENQLNAEMQFLLRKFRTVQNDLTNQILATNFYDRLFKKLKLK